MNDSMMSIADAAEAIGVTVDTLRTWALTGRLAGSVFATREGRLVPRSEVERLLAERETASQRQPSDWVPLLPPKQPPVYSPPRVVRTKYGGATHDR